jgi:hypothetical protein
MAVLLRSDRRRCHKPRWVPSAEVDNGNGKSRETVLGCARPTFITQRSAVSDAKSPTQP